MAALRIVVITLLVVGCAQGARAQDQTTPEAPEVITGEPAPQSFDVFAGNASESTKDRGIIGGGGYYYAVVTIAPRYEISGDGEVRILLGDSRVTKEVIQRQDPGGLAVLNWEFELVEMDYPEGLVQQVTAVFDGETVVSDRQGASVYTFTMPEGSSRLERFMVRWAWGRHDETLVFNAQAGGFPAWLGVVALLLLAGAGLLWMRRGDRDDKKKDEKEKEEEKEEDVCDILKEGEEGSRSRKDYPQWIKDLLCAYLRADFTNKEARTEFVRTVLARYRENLGGSVSATATVVHIVTNDPATLDVQKDGKQKVNRVKDVAARRSFQQPDKAAIGLHERFFHTPRPRKKHEAYPVLPRAETALLLIFGLKKLADLIAESPDGMTKEVAEKSLKTALKAFRDDHLFFAEMPGTIEVDHIGKKPVAPARPAEPPSLEDGRNLKEYEPDPKLGVRVKDVKENEPLGKTLPVIYPFIIRFKAWSSWGAYESIEEYAAYQSKVIVHVLIRTCLETHVYYGVPRKDGKVKTVYTDDGSENLTDTIKEHEKRHVDDTWQAWSTRVLHVLEQRLRSPDFGGFEKLKVVRTPRKAGERIYIDLEAAYFFPDKDAAKDATKQLKERFATKALDPLRDDFDEANAALAEAFHKMWRGIDGEGKRTTEGRTFEPETPRADKAREGVPEPEFSPF